MLVFGHNVDFVRKKRGGQKVMTVLFIRENVDNYGWAQMLKYTINMF